jgi:AraC-like DNA-binding protein
VQLERLATYDEMFRRGPVGRYAVGEQFLIWCSHAELCGLVFWGQPDASDLARLARVFDHGEGTGIAVPCDFVIDARRLERIDANVFADWRRETDPRLEHIARRVRRQAVVVRPDAMSSAVVSGAYALIGSRLAWKLVDDLDAALRWLDLRDPEPLARYLDGLVVEVLAGSAVVDQLRARLRDGGLRASLADLGASLGLSARSLQRRLREAGTSFRAEQERARLAAAQRLLLDTDDKVATIAAEVGASSESNFISFFRRLTGTSPAAWRAGRRESGRGYSSTETSE